MGLTGRDFGFWDLGFLGFWGFGISSSFGYDALEFFGFLGIGVFRFQSLENTMCRVGISGFREHNV